ncbi:hypothetical protein D3C86_1242900 [compost metagenome]
MERAVGEGVDLDGRGRQGHVGGEALGRDVVAHDRRAGRHVDAVVRGAGSGGDPLHRAARGGDDGGGFGRLGVGRRGSVDPGHPAGASVEDVEPVVADRRQRPVVEREPEGRAEVRDRHGGVTGRGEAVDPILRGHRDVDVPLGVMDHVARSRAEGVQELDRSAAVRMGGDLGEGPQGLAELEDLLAAGDGPELPGATVGVANRLDGSCGADRLVSAFLVGISVGLPGVLASPAPHVDRAVERAIGAAGLIDAGCDRAELALGRGRGRDEGEAADLGLADVEAVAAAPTGSEREGERVGNARHEGAQDGAVDLEDGVGTVQGHVRLVRRGVDG